MGPHPFPPAFRWVLFPLLAALASVAAGVATAPRVGGVDFSGVAFFGALSFASAFGASFAHRSAYSLVLAPLSAWILWRTLLAALGSDPFSAWPSAAGPLTRGEAFLTFTALSTFQSSAHALALRWNERPWRRIAAVYGVASLGAMLALAWVGREGADARIGHVLALWSQGAAYFVARALARRAPAERPPPLPPVVRWTLFPALALLAGAAGAGLPGLFLGTPAPHWAIAGGALGAWGALGAVVSVRGGVVLAAAPFAAAWGAVLAFSLKAAWLGSPLSLTLPLQSLRLGELDLPLLAATAALMIGAHYTTWRLDALVHGGWGPAIYAGAAGFAALISPDPNWAAATFFCVLAQIVPGRVAGRLVTMYPK